MAWMTIRLGNGRWGTIDLDNPSAPPQVTIAGTTDYIKAYEYDTEGLLIYEGWALPGSSKADPVWKIKKYTYEVINDSNYISDEQWADGSADQVQVWDDRAGLSYS